MATLRERLESYSRIGLDSSIFIYQFEAHPNYLPLSEQIFKQIEKKNLAGITSTITLMELSVRPWQLGREDAAREYETLLINFPNLTIVDIDREVARQAAKLRAAHLLRPADALQVASCLVHQGEAFVTNDRRLARVGKVLDLLILDDYLSAI